MKSAFLAFLMALTVTIFSGCSKPGVHYDILITNAMIYDGTGSPGYAGSVGIMGDTIAAVGELENATGTETVDAGGMAVSPGFVNMLSWATESLIADPRGMSDLLQGVTLVVMGEGWSMGPLSDTMKAQMQKDQGDIKFDVTWNTLGGYLQYLEDRGISPNVASFVGATTLRIHEIGFADRPPTPEELDRMKQMVRDAMEEGALGVGSSLIYAPAFYAKTDELIELCKAASPYGGRYITHMRSEGNKFVEAVDEVIKIAKEANIGAEIYHLKAGGSNNWPKMDVVIAKIDSARKAGIDIAANMYNYVAGATGLDASMPPWVQEGGYEAWAKRLQDPAIRKKVMAEMKTDAQDWENLYYATGDPNKVLLVGFKNDTLKKYTGKSVAEMATIRHTSPEEVIMDLVVQDGSRVGTVYFLMSEENVKKQLQLPYITFGSDAEAPATEGVFLKSSTHPRAYGNFARLLGKYVRDEKVIPLEDAIHKLTSMATDRLKIAKRGRLTPGNYADVVIFDPATIADHATFEKPHQYSTGVIDVWVNGKQVVSNGEHTGVTPGRFVKGPGYRK
ncbi:MAG: D-aminoacylase [Lewinellaceae bacterium]|nr:D-aminoacylase [Lewinellaceae bacterium]